jgi:Fe-S-cluster containining protein
VTKTKLFFECQRCGYCCQGETTVSLDPADVERLVAHLGMSFDDVMEKYLRRTGAVTQMKIVDGHCIFYDNGCTVHPGRPWRCAQWPLHPSILTDHANFLAIKGSCPGLAQGMEYEEFRHQLAEHLDRALSTEDDR